MRSHGFEITLSTKNIKTPTFQWSTDFIFGHSKTKVTDLKTRSFMFSLVSGNGFTQEGYPHRGLFSIPFAGLDKSGFPTFYISDKKGEKILVNSSNYGSIDFQERENLSFLKYEGPTDPTITGSLGNIFTYKNWKLNVFVTYSAGNKVRLDPVFKSGYNDLDATPKEFKNRWVVKGNEEITDIPVIASIRDAQRIPNLYLAYNAYNYSSARIADGGFVRMKEVSLTYTLPKNLLKTKMLKSASIKVQGTNLFLIYSDKKLNGQDPEFFRSGGVSAPVPKQFTATLRLGF
ncbi:TonB-dependent receptor [Bacteroides pyogenes JCM 10003]|nr:TonB-dependent receptor [Bacteroides pyogenes JCM 10003]